MCDVTEKLVLLCHCGRISNRCRELTPAIPLLPLVCVQLNQTVATADCLHRFSSAWLDLWFPCILRASRWAGHPELSVVIPIMLTAGWQEHPPSSPYRGLTSLFVFLRAVGLHCKHHCCIIHNRREAAAPEDWQVKGDRLEGKSWATQGFQPFPKNPVWKHDIRPLIEEFSSFLPTLE